MGVHSLQQSPGDVFKVKVLGKSSTGQLVNGRASIQVLDRKDGSFIVRYKLHDSVRDLEIHVLYNDKHVTGSPFQTQGKRKES